MRQLFKNTASVPVLGIAPNETRGLSVDADGLLDTAYARGLVKSGRLQKVDPPKQPNPPKATKPKAKTEPLVEDVNNGGS